jgi:hypothetical protein
MDARVSNLGHPMPEIAGFSPATGNIWGVDDALRDRRYYSGCDGECVGLGVGCREWPKRKGSKESS